MYQTNMKERPQELPESSRGLACCHPGVNVCRASTATSSPPLEENTGQQMNVKSAQSSARQPDVCYVEETRATNRRFLRSEEESLAGHFQTEHRRSVAELRDFDVKMDGALHDKQGKAKGKTNRSKSIAGTFTANKRPHSLTDELDVKTECSFLRHSSCIPTPGGPTALYFDEDITSGDPSVVSQPSNLQWWPRNQPYYPSCPHCTQEILPNRSSSYPREGYHPSLPTGHIHVEYHPPQDKREPCGKRQQVFITNNDQIDDEIFLTEVTIDLQTEQASSRRSHYSNLPSYRGTSWPGSTELGVEEEDITDYRRWDYSCWRMSRTDSRCSNYTLYANTSDPGAPEPTYENVFECALRESIAETASWPTPSPSGSHINWLREPIYATVGGQPGDEEGLTAYMHEESSRSGSVSRFQDPALALDACTDGLISPSSSTATLCPEDECQSVCTKSTYAEGDDASVDRRISTSLSSKVPECENNSETQPPKLPPKLSQRKPPGLKLQIPSTDTLNEDCVSHTRHLPASNTPNEVYGLQIRLPVQSEGSLSSTCSDAPTSPIYPSPLQRDKVPLYFPSGSTLGNQDGSRSEEGDRRGALYVVVGSTPKGKCEEMF